MALDSKLPATWSDADATSLANYNESMAQRFAELRLCAADWKANMIATDSYPSWRHNWLKKRVKEGKRHADNHSDDNAPATKKPKVLLESGNQLPSQLSPSIPENRPKDSTINMVRVTVVLAPFLPHLQRSSKLTMLFS